MRQGISPKIAKQEAESETLERMKKLDAAHILDSIVGGHEEDAEHMAMRPRGANRRVGSAWSKGRCREALVNAVKKALKAGKKTMDVRLEVCDEGNGVS
ncbi:hypothetical protein A0U92_12885 [Acetobacter aceti]|uniref:Novel toxin 15 domain-containing protein n=1 Tax=Acetobacter aceti TaxID=435 RepID=A0A1U9KID4_ACEAC|nr:polymorphic toxin type 15 domain-containing protein [Acetobacter aceti]AQS85517.1 hypothetical protein A0U92_12885 [Acetobacter aceti]